MTRKSTVRNQPNAVPMNLRRPALQRCGCPSQPKQSAHSYSIFVFAFERLIRGTIVSLTLRVHATFAANLTKRSDSPSAARAHHALGGPFLSSIPRHYSSHTYQRAIYIVPAHAARPQLNLIHLARLPSCVSAPARGLVGFSRSRWRSVLDCVTG